jgi:hypothetical protein
MDTLDVLVKKDPGLHDLSYAYLLAARDRDESRMDACRAPLMEALKAAGADYVARIEILRELQAEAMAGRMEGVRGQLRKQVAERHQGR